MRVQALWYGGCNYAAPNPSRDLETFSSLQAAKEALQDRASGDPYYPCVDQDQTEMHVYFGEYTENGPDRILTLGRRGNVRVSR